jgi:hypothetical protein
MTKPKTIKDLYSFPGFEALLTLKDIPEDPGARVITLRRRQKKALALVAGTPNAVFTTIRLIVFGIFQELVFAYGLNSSTAGSNAIGARL